MFTSQTAPPRQASQMFAKQAANMKPQPDELLTMAQIDEKESGVQPVCDSSEKEDSSDLACSHILPLLHNWALA